MPSAVLSRKAQPGLRGGRQVDLVEGDQHQACGGEQGGPRPVVLLKSGFLVLEKLRSRPGGMIPTIMITGNEGSRHRAYAEMLGVRDYIRKPFAMEKLVRAIDRCSASGRGEASDDV